MEQLPDEELVAVYRSRLGSPDADSLLNELFQRHYARVALWCFRLTGDRESAADLSQEVFIKAFRNLKSYRGDSKFSTWLYSITRNHCFNELKARAGRSEQASELLLVGLIDRAPSPYTQLEQKNLAAALRDWLRSSLTEVEGRVMTLHYGE